MIKPILHIGLTVSNLERTCAFYEKVLGFEPRGRLVMEDEATDRLFGRKGCRAEVAYFGCQGDGAGQPLIELIAFTSHQVEEVPTNLFRTGVTEICFQTDDIQREYERLKAEGVEFLSAPENFDFSSAGFGASKAIYFRDPDGIILELIEPVRG